VQSCRWVCNRDCSQSFTSIFESIYCAPLGWCSKNKCSRTGLYCTVNFKKCKAHTYDRKSIILHIYIVTNSNSYRCCSSERQVSLKLVFDHLINGFREYVVWVSCGHNCCWSWGECGLYIVYPERYSVIIRQLLLLLILTLTSMASRRYLSRMG
jgi:hypothetical protein